MTTRCDVRERLPASVRRALRPRSFGLRSRVGPVSEHWGYDRGTPIDRWYIDRFLSAHAQDIRGRVLEVKDDAYTIRFGAGVDRVDVLDVDRDNERATVVADLADAREVPDETYDCFVLTQTLQYVQRVAEAVGHAHRLLARGGTLLATVPAVSRVDHRQSDTRRSLALHRCLVSRPLRRRVRGGSRRGNDVRERALRSRLSARLCGRGAVGRRA